MDAHKSWMKCRWISQDDAKAGPDSHQQAFGRKNARDGSSEPIVNGLQVSFFVIVAPILEPPVNGS